MHGSITLERNKFDIGTQFVDEKMRKTCGLWRENGAFEMHA